MDIARANALEKEASELNGGHCTHCEQTIKIYRYGISDSMVRVLHAMAKRTKLQLDGQDKAGRTIDVDVLDLKHSERTQLTKMRFHGLVAKVKEDDGTQIPRHWLVTTKGWQFLKGGDVAAKVVVYNNQVLGHDGGVTNIKRIIGGNGDYEQAPVTEAESRTFAHVRQPEFDKIVRAVWLGYSAGQLVNNQEYTLKMEKLQFGKPLKVWVPGREPEGIIEYKDIASFAKSWRIVATVANAK